MLEALEVGVDDRRHLLAVAALRRRHVLVEDRLLGHHRRLAPAEPLAGRGARHHRLDLADPAGRLDVQAHGDEGLAAAFLHRAEEAGLLGLGIEEIEFVVAAGLDRAPEPVAKLQLLAVLGELDVARQRQPRGIVRHQGVQIAVDEAVQARPLAGRRHDVGRLGRGGVRAGQQSNRGAQRQKRPFHEVPPSSFLVIPPAGAERRRVDGPGAAPGGSQVP